MSPLRGLIFLGDWDPALARWARFFRASGAIRARRVSEVHREERPASEGRPYGLMDAVLWM